MEIRPGSDADRPALVAALGQRQFFSGRLAGQRAGVGVLLVALVDGRPVGDVYLDREPAAEQAVRRHLPDVPTLTHLEVLGPLQRRGIGTALIHAGEDTARRLYERLGYADWGHGTVETSWKEHDHAGPPVTMTETIDLLVRRL